MFRRGARAGEDAEPASWRATTRSGGLDQIVGESGWQLSEGERSRVFLGRALLAGGDLLVIDECFSALDPESLETAHGAVRRRASTVLMVAHP